MTLTEKGMSGQVVDPNYIYVFYFKLVFSKLIKKYISVVNECRIVIISEIRFSSCAYKNHIIT